MLLPNAFTMTLTSWPRTLPTAEMMRVPRHAPPIRTSSFGCMSTCKRPPVMANPPRTARETTASPRNENMGPSGYRPIEPTS
jgi:hypothetical protein